MTDAMNSTQTEAQEPVNIQYSRVAVKLGEIFLATFGGILLGQFVQITRYIEDGHVPAELATYTQEFSPSSIIGPLFALWLIWAGKRHADEIDDAFQPWMRFISAYQSPDCITIGPADREYLRANLIIVAIVLPLLAVAVPLLFVAGSGSVLETALNSAAFVAAGVGLILSYKLAERYKPRVEIEVVE